MIFNDLIQELNEDVRNAIDELFNAAWTNQSHPQDLLLIDQHGYYDNVFAGVPENPNVIGPGEIGFSEDTFYEFIDIFSVDMRTLYIIWLRSSPFSSRV